MFLTSGCEHAVSRPVSRLRGCVLTLLTNFMSSNPRAPKMAKSAICGVFCCLSSVPKHDEHAVSMPVSLLSTIFSAGDAHECEQLFVLLGVPPQASTFSQALVFPFLLPVRWSLALTPLPFFCRKMMDSGQIDFYQHDTVCTNTCRSTKFDLLINNTRFPPQGSGLPTSTSPQGGAQTLKFTCPT